MLIRFSLQNFKSFDQEAELSMIPSNDLNFKRKHITNVDTVNVLRHSVIYGANASGKSNWIEGINFFQYTVKHGLTLWSKNLFCKVRKENYTKESMFEILFSVQGHFFAYGFSAVLSEQKIHGEWLYELYSDGGSHPIYEREISGKIVLDQRFSDSLNDDDKDKMKVYRNDFLGTGDQLFLTFMNQNKKNSGKSPMSLFKLIFRWLTRNVVVITPDKIFSSLSYYNDSQSLDKVNELIQKFDTGISQVEIRGSSFDEMKTILPYEVFMDLQNNVKKRILKGEKSFRVTLRSNEVFFSVSVDSDGFITVSTLCFRHENSDFDFLFNEESDGTRRLFDLLDIILGYKRDVVYVVDELERSLHPKLTEFFLRLFMKDNMEKKSQLIFTTHEASIMDRSLFRRDEIWFVERSANSTSRLYSLDRFQDRYDNQLSKAYLEGRYGAIPVLSTFDCMEGDDRAWG